MKLPFTIWCINGEIYIIYSKEDRVFFVDCWRNKVPIILSAFSQNSIYNALLNVGNFIVVYSNIKVWQEVDQFLTTCDVQTYNSNSTLRGVSIFEYKGLLLVSMWYWSCLEVLIFCHTNWVIVLIRFQTTNVLLALILKSVVGSRRIHFIKVKVGTCGMLKNHLQIASFDSRLWSLSSWLIWITTSDRVHHLALLHTVSLLQLASVL